MLAGFLWQRSLSLIKINGVSLLCDKELEMKKTLLAIVLVTALVVSFAPPKASATVIPPDTGAGIAVVVGEILGGSSQSALPKTQMQAEFFLLNSHIETLSLEKHTATGTFQFWKAVSRAEKASLKTDKSLSRMAAF
jgi:hypothetical protein